MSWADPSSGLTLRYPCLGLLGRPLERLVRFVLVEHPTRSRLILLSTDITLEPLAIIQLHGWRFKIKVGFKQAIHTVGTYAYHFWMHDMIPIRRGDGNQYLHPQSEHDRAQVRRKLAAYERHIPIGLIVQGLLQYLAVFDPCAVWRFFGSWLRTENHALAPSELVVAHALRNSFPDSVSCRPAIGPPRAHVVPRLRDSKPLGINDVSLLVSVSPSGWKPP